MSTTPVAPQIDNAPIEAYDPALYQYAEVMTARDGLHSLTDAEVAQYKEDGFLAVENVFTPVEVTAAAAGLSDLVNGKVPGFHGVVFEAWTKDRLAELSGEQRENAVRKLMDFTPYDARLKALERHPVLQAAVARLLGTEPKLTQEMALLKPPRGREKPWHQDHAYFDYPLGTPVVGCWIALDDATPENGCMHVLRGSQRTGPQLHFSKRDWQVCDTDVLGRRSAAVPLRAGGCLLFDGLLIHGTPANQTNQRRRALQFHYVPVGAQKWTPAERLAIFGSEGKNVTC